MSGGALRNAASASAQLSASTTSKPRPRRKSQTPKRTAGSSSTSRTRLPDGVTHGRPHARPGHGQPHGHDGAALGPVARPDPAAVVLDDALDDREAEAGAAAAAREERLEDPGQVLRAEARARVPDAAVDPSLSVDAHQLGLDYNRALRRRVADGVVEQVLEDLRQAAAVHPHARQVRRRRRLDRRRRRCRPARGNPGPPRRRRRRRRPR